MPRPRSRTERAAPPPLDRARLDALALAYVGRFATSEARLARYLARKLRERGWDDAQPMDLALSAAVARCVRLGFVDDREFARMRGAALARRGLGVRRVRAQLAADGIDEGDAADTLVDAADRRLATALAFARRRRLGPFARDGAALDARQRDRAMAAFLRGGHDFDVARRILAATPDDAAALAELDAASEAR